MSYGYWQPNPYAPGVNTNYSGYSGGTGYAQTNYGVGRGYGTPVVKYTGYQPTRGAFSGHRGGGGFQRNWGNPLAASVSKGYNYDKSMKVYMHGSSAPGNSFNRPPSGVHGKRPGDFQNNSQYGKKPRSNIKPPTSASTTRYEDFTEDKFGGEKQFRSFEGPVQTGKKPDVIKMIGVKKSLPSTSSQPSTPATPSSSATTKVTPVTLSSSASVTPKASSAASTPSKVLPKSSAVISKGGTSSKVAVIPKATATVPTKQSVMPKPAVLTPKSSTVQAAVTGGQAGSTSTLSRGTGATVVTVKSNTSLEEGRSKDAKLKCRFCIKVLPTLVEKLAHEAMCPNQKYNCGFCSQAFPSAMKLESHLRGSHVLGKLPHVCCVCDLVFMDYMVINNHMEAHVTNSEITKQELLKKSEEAKKETKHYPIQELPRARDNTIERVVEFTANEKGTHHGYKCPYCKMLIADFTWIHQHIREHTSYLPNWCGFCTKRFFDKAQLTRHLTAEHVKSVPHECTECSLKMKKASSVNNHWIQHHVGKGLVKQMGDKQDLGTDCFKVLCCLCGVLFHNKTVFLNHQGQCKSLHPLESK